MKYNTNVCTRHTSQVNQRRGTAVSSFDVFHSLTKHNFIAISVWPHWVPFLGVGRSHWVALRPGINYRNGMFTSTAKWYRSLYGESTANRPCVGVRLIGVVGRSTKNKTRSEWHNGIISLMLVQRTPLHRVSPGAEVTAANERTKEIDLFSECTPGVLYRYPEQPTAHPWRLLMLLTVRIHRLTPSSAGHAQNGNYIRIITSPAGPRSTSVQLSTVSFFGRWMTRRHVICANFFAVQLASVYRR